MLTLRPVQDFGLKIIGGLLWPLADIAWNPWAKLYWLYLLGAAVMAAAVYVWRAPDRSLRGMVKFLFPRRVFLHPSAIADYKMLFLNAALIAAVFIPYMLISSAAAANAIKGALVAMTGVAGLGFQVGWGATIVYTLLDLLALDAAFFIAHYMQHKIPVLWEFHKTHHSAEVLTPFTVERMHPVDQILNFTLASVLPGALAGVSAFVFTRPATGIAVNGMNVGLFVFYLFGVHLRHSHVWLMFPPWLARHISSPAMHLIHHSSDPKHADKNMAQIFNFWDRLTGTLYLPTREEAVSFGLAGGEHAKFRSLPDLYVQPFRGLLARYRRQPAGGGVAS
jgi:sterol desaturase/sphingolipid hydroxylase (fatty acid hydroxylase superfamily)